MEILAEFLPQAQNYCLYFNRLLTVTFQVAQALTQAIFSLAQHYPSTPLVTPASSHQVLLGFCQILISFPPLTAAL